jgi:hypothetical protein
MEREDPSPLFSDKLNEKALSERMKEKFDMFRGACRLDVASINDECVNFAMQVMDYKFLRKCHRDQVSASAIASDREVRRRHTMNWATFLVN